MSVRGSIVVSRGAENLVLGLVIALVWVVETEVHEAFEGDSLMFPGKIHG